MRGVLNLNKPSGLSSYDVIRRLHRIIGPTPIGHAGTLDPMASGVLLVLVGEATRLSRFLMATDKEYQAEVLFGKETDTDDTTGRIIAEAVVPDLSKEVLCEILRRFLGVQSQVPPRFSALKQAGRPLYRLARRGWSVEPKPRPVTFHELELLSWNPPCARLRAVVSSGTYIRALARDLGRAAGTVATLSGLVRTRSGRFTLNQALSLDRADPETIVHHLVTIPDALPELPRLNLSEVQAHSLLQGQMVKFQTAPDVEHALALTSEQRFLCLVAVRDQKLRPLRVIYAE